MTSHNKKNQDKLIKQKQDQKIENYIKAVKILQQKKKLITTKLRCQFLKALADGNFTVFWTLREIKFDMYECTINKYKL